MTTTIETTQDGIRWTRSPQSDLRSALKTIMPAGARLIWTSPNDAWHAIARERIGGGRRIGRTLAVRIYALAEPCPSTHHLAFCECFGSLPEAIRRMYVA